MVEQRRAMGMKQTRVLVMCRDVNRASRIALDLSKNLGVQATAQPVLMETARNGIGDHYDVVVLDVTDPLGLRALRAIRENWGRNLVPVVALGSSQNDEFQAMLCGSDGFLRWKEEGGAGQFSPLRLGRLVSALTGA